MSFSHVLKRRTRIALACAVVMGMSFSFIGSRSIWSTDEGRYTAVALEMMRTGDWVHPGFNLEEPHYTKPPMTYWALSASMEIFGKNEWAARLPGALAFAVTCLAVGLLASRIVPGAGAAGAAAYAVSLLPAIASNVITTDTLLAMWEALALLAFSCAWPALDANRDAACGIAAGVDGGALRRWPIRLMWLAMGFAFMTKGPPGIVFIVPFAIVSWKLGGWRGLGRLFDPVGLLLFAVSGLWWYGIIVLGKSGMGEYFLVNEFVDRIFTSAHKRNSQFYKAFYYMPILVFGLLPWSGVWLAQKPWRRWRRVALRTVDPAGVLLAWTVWLPFAFFFFAKSRLPLYILPLFAPALVGIMRLPERKFWKSSGAWTIVCATAVVLLSVRFSAGMFEDRRDMKAMLMHLDVAGQYSEIVFVDRRPLYGLSFYSGVYCETVQLFHDMGKELLSSELADYDEGKAILLVIYPQDEPVVLDMLEHAGWVAPQRRLYKNYLSLHAVRKSAGKTIQAPGGRTITGFAPAERPQGQETPQRERMLESTDIAQDDVQAIQRQ